MILVDTSVLLDLVTDDPIWAPGRSTGSKPRRRRMHSRSTASCTPKSVRYHRIEDLEAMIARARLTIAPIPRAALFLAGKVFQRYRAQGGTRAGVFRDFFVGAHAAVAAVPLLTRDTARYRTYFPRLDLIPPC